jgi:hypothetical protein
MAVETLVAQPACAVANAEDQNETDNPTQGICEMRSGLAPCAVSGQALKRGGIPLH